MSPDIAHLLATGQIHMQFAFINFLWGLAFLVASYAIQSFITPGAEKPKPAAFEDFDFPQFEEGTPQAVFFGDNWTPDWCVTFYGNMRTSAVKSKGGKK